ncbi:MAG: thiamine/thiamine pyrophosphate ABC transporter permease ThiP [Pseudomonadota bacterium]
MAGRAQPVSAWPGIGAAGFLALLILGTLLAVALRAEAGSGLGRADWAAIRFTLIQATLSGMFSVLLAIPVARALARRRFTGRRVLIALLGVPFILPVIIAVLGLLEVFGRAGWVSTGLGALGFDPIRVYGLHGVVLAHVFLNLPLATRLILQGWQEVPAERFRLAAQLGCDGRAMFWLIEWPMLRRILPGCFAVVFAICLTSFAVALTLGGGPKATTIELAIYQAFRFDFDLGRAALLSVVQLVLTIIAAALALWLSTGTGFGKGLDREVRRWDGATGFARACDGAWIAAAALFLMMPLAAIVLSGLPRFIALPPAVWMAAITSLLVAGMSTVLLLSLALPMAFAIARGGRGIVELAGLLGLAASPLVIGTGLFIVIRSVQADPFALALPVTALVNAIMALPFALRILVPSARDVVERYGKMGLSLRMSGAPFVRLVLLPRMRAQIGFAAGLAMALSMGDLGVITLFADPDIATLPLQIYRLMGAYRLDDAAAASLLLLVLSIGVFWVLDRGGRRHAEA